MTISKLASLTLVIFSFLQFGAVAQDSPWRVGFSFGSSQSEIVGSPLIERFFDPIQTFTPAINIHYAFNQNFSLISEFRYERKGMQANQQLFSEAGTVVGLSEQTHHFNYIVVPVLLRLTTGEKWQLFANVGPYLAHLLNQEVLYETTIDGNDVSQTEDETSRYNRTDFGFSAGLGLGILVSERFFVNVEARNNFGLSNVRREEVVGSEVLNTKSTNLLLGVSYLF